MDAGGVQVRELEVGAGLELRRLFGDNIIGFLGIPPAGLGVTCCVRMFGDVIYFNG